MDANPVKFSDLKVGAFIQLGSYAPSRGRPQFGRPSPSPILWTKCSPTHLISTFILDLMVFDAPEQRPGQPHYYREQNGDYLLSNIHQYLNADGDGWFVPTHELDAAPDYASRPGFLTDFTTDELDMLAVQQFDRTECLVRLPLSGEIIPGHPETFSYFKRYGRRTQYDWNRFGSFASYYLSDQHQNPANGCVRLGRDGQKHTFTYPGNREGIRPVISVKADAAFTLSGSGPWIPVIAPKSPQEDDSMFDLLFS